MLLADVLTERVHVFAKVMAGALLLFKVNFNLMDVFLLLFSGLFAITSDHGVNYC